MFHCCSMRSQGFSFGAKNDKPYCFFLLLQIERSALSAEADEALFSDAPDHFLDAIMSVLMRDPVKLPASGQIVDR